MNLQQLVAEVEAHGFSDATYGGRIVNYLNDAYQLVCRRADYYIDEATQTFQTTAGQTDIALPANWARTRSLLDTDLERELEDVGIRDIDRAFVTTGTPMFYAQDGVNIRLYPTADGVHNLMMRYWLLPTPLANSLDTPTLPSDWHRLLPEYAIHRCYWGDDDPQMGQAWEAKFEKTLAEFEADQKFPDSDRSTQIRSMWGESPLGSYGWSRWPVDEGY